MASQYCDDNNGGNGNDNDKIDHQFILSYTITGTFSEEKEFRFSLYTTVIRVCLFDKSLFNMSGVMFSVTGLSYDQCRIYLRMTKDHNYIEIINQNIIGNCYQIDDEHTITITNIYESFEGDDLKEPDL